MTNPHAHLPPNSLELRGKALEDAYCHAFDERLLANLREELAQFEERMKLASVSGIIDENVLKDLCDAGVRADSLMALRFLPMVSVAWADDLVTPEERSVVLEAAVEEHVAPETPAYTLLTMWLKEPPDARITKAWREYVRNLARLMPAESLTQFQSRTSRLCQRVARAAGGVLGFHTISPRERAVIDSFVEAWDAKPKKAR